MVSLFYISRILKIKKRIWLDSRKEREAAVSRVFFGFKACYPGYYMLLDFKWNPFGFT